MVSFEIMVVRLTRASLSFDKVLMITTVKPTDTTTSTQNQKQITQRNTIMIITIITPTIPQTINNTTQSIQMEKPFAIKDSFISSDSKEV